MKILVIIVVMFALLVCPVITLAGDVIFIGNPSIKPSSLTKDEINKIFLGKKIAWKDKSKIVVALQKDSAVHRMFLKKYIHQSPARFGSLWKSKIFTGKMSALNIFNNNKEVVDFVTDTIGAIGYVSPETNLKNVKIIGIK